LEFGGPLAAVGLAVWLVYKVVGADARQNVLDFNFLVVPWVIMPLQLLQSAIAYKIGVAFAEFGRKRGKCLERTALCSDPVKTGSDMVRLCVPTFVLSRLNGD
jgi:hypothetical protein